MLETLFNIEPWGVEASLNWKIDNLRVLKINSSQISFWLETPPGMMVRFWREIVDWIELIICRYPEVITGSTINRFRMFKVHVSAKIGFVLFKIVKFSILISFSIKLIKVAPVLEVWVPGEIWLLIRRMLVRFCRERYSSIFRNNPFPRKMLSNIVRLSKLPFP